MINGKTKIFAVIGCPIEHTKSPQIHEILNRQFGLNNAFIPLLVPQNALEGAVRGMECLGFLGYNITIPHKSAIMPYLAEISEDARLIGAVNTVKIENGRSVGYNTDGEGFVNSLKAENVDVSGKNVLIMGAGGSVRSVAVALARHGVANLSILNRTRQRAEEICDIINGSISKIAVVTEQLREDTDIFINATPLGMFPNESGCPVENLDFLAEGSVVCDLIYNPLETTLLKMARGRGLKAINGKGMLVHQAIMAFKIWTGIKDTGGLAEKIISEV